MKTKLTVALMGVFLFASSSFAQFKYQGSAAPATVAEGFNFTEIESADAYMDLNTVGTSDQIIDGVRYIEGTWESGQYRSITGLDGTSPLKTITLSNTFRFIAPANGTGPLNLMVIGVHGGNLSANDATYKQLALNGTAVFLHGSDNVTGADHDATELGMIDRSDMVQQGLLDLQNRNASSFNDIQISNYGYALARTQMLAITLGKAVVSYIGRSTGDIALHGESKEGGSTWLACAVDTRIDVCAPGKMSRFTANSFNYFEWNSGCGPWNGPTTKQYIPWLLETRDWHASAPGQAAKSAMLVDNYKTQLKAPFYYISGDCGYPGLHDANQGTMGMEDAFLDGFTNKDWRYNRNCSDENETGSKLNQFEAIAGILNGGNKGPEVVDTLYYVPNGNIFAEIDTAGNDGLIDNVYAYWATSPTREFNNAGQAAWTKVAMEFVQTQPSGLLLYRTPSSINWEESHMKAFYVQTEKTFTAGGVTWKRRSTSSMTQRDEFAYENCPGPPY